ncbi:hypothetical protein Tco_1265398 [Tanacetum coccineum]
MSEFKQTNQFDKVVSLIPGIVDNYLASKMKEIVDSTMKAIIKEQVQAQVSKTIPKIKKYVIESLGAEVLLEPSPEPPPDHRSTAVNGSGQRRSTTVNGGAPLLTTAGPPPNHHSTVVDRQSTIGSGFGSGQV